MNIIFVALGGALGAVLRYLISLIPYKGSFPILTLVTNLLGALIIGIVVGIAEENKNMPENLILFLKTGFCGGFTTFSTFSLETLNLWQKKNYGLSMLYAGLSFVLCVVGVYIGKILVKGRA